MRPAPPDPPEISDALWHGFSGRVGWDIGANCGQTLGRMLGAFEHVIAFEPAAECKPFLDQWTYRGNVTIIEAAVSDVDGAVTLAALPDKIDTGQLVTIGTSGMEWSRSEWDKQHEREVLSRRVDTLVEIVPPPDFMKIDVEGHELMVLTGAWQTITDYAPDMLIEFHSADLYEAVVECLTAHNYQVIDTVRHPHYPTASPLWWGHGWIRAFVTR